MQETSTILQEFARQNNIRVPNYPSDMFSLTHSQHEVEEQGSDEREDSEEEEGEKEGDEMDFEEEDD